MRSVSVTGLRSAVPRPGLPSSPSDRLTSGPRSRSRQNTHYDARMRYLAEPFAVGALRRGKAIAQFLGPAKGFDHESAIRWVEVNATRDGFMIVLQEAKDVGGERFADLWEFP